MVDVFGEGNLKNDGWSNNRLLVDYFCVWRSIRCHIYVGIYFSIAHTFAVGCLHLTGIIISLKSHVLLSFFQIAGMRIYYGYILLLISRLIDWPCNSVYCLLFVCLLLPIAGNGEEEMSIAIQISVCRASGLSCWTFRGDGLFSCLVYVNCTDTRVSIPSFWRLLFVCRYSREHISQ